MAQYKVLQDIEAEDKLLGPLSLRQFLYAVAGVVLGFVAFRLLSVQPLLAIPFLPFVVLFLVLAAPFGKDQPSEVWLLAKIRFFLKPRRRVWDQAGLQELVTVTVPRKIEQQRTDGLSQREVKSRLRALADTIDSRGWAVKGVNTNLASNPAYFQRSSERLFDMNALMPATNPYTDIPVENDPLDAVNPMAKHFDQMVADANQQHRQQVMNQIQQARQGVVPNPQPKPSQTTRSQPPQASASSPGVTDDDSAQASVTAKKRAVKMELAQNNDLNVDAIARQANRDDELQDEVVISLR